MTSLTDLGGDDLGSAFDSVFNDEDELGQMVQQREQETRGAQQMNQPSQQMVEQNAPPQTNMQPEMVYYQQPEQMQQHQQHQEMYQNYMGNDNQSTESVAEKVFKTLKRLSTIFVLAVALFNPLTRSTLTALPFISHQAISYVILAVMFFSTYGTVEYFLI